MEDSNGDSTHIAKSNESLAAVVRRHKGETKAMKQRTDRMRSSVSKKDKAGKARIIEEIKQLYDEMEKRHAVELKNATDVEDEKKMREIANDTSKMKLEDKAMPSFYAGNEDKQESKAARRRRKKAERESEAQRRIEEERSKMGPSQRELEMEKLREQLKPLSLTVHTIKPDGHCLYSAVQHQLTVNEVDTNVEKSVQGLRDATAEHMSRNSEDYLPFLETVDGSSKAFKVYCDTIKNTAAWGGQLELRALSKALKVGIEVYSADMPLVTMGKAEGSSPRLKLAYHRAYYGLGEHYNSLVPTEENDAMKS